MLYCAVSTGIATGIIIDNNLFLPGTGGYCAYGVAQGYAVKIEPDAVLQCTARGQVAELKPRLLSLLPEAVANPGTSMQGRWQEAGVPADLAATLAAVGQAHTLLGVVAVARRLELPPLRVAEVHYQLGEALGLDALSAGVDVLPRQVRWDAMARAALRDELLSAQAALTAAVLAQTPDATR